MVRTVARVTGCLCGQAGLQHCVRGKYAVLVLSLFLTAGGRRGLSRNNNTLYGRARVRRSGSKEYAYQYFDSCHKAATLDAVPKRYKERLLPPLIPGNDHKVSIRGIRYHH